MRRLLLALAATVALPSAANAHPFGPPPTATVSAQGRSVVVDWRSAPDDAIAIGEQLGLLPPGSTEAYREAATQVAPSAAAEAALARSPLLHGYLTDNIRVVQDGAPCRPTVPPITDFVREGARVVAECPEPVRTVTLSLSMLTDIHEAYRTFAVGRASEPDQFVYTLRTPTRDWTFGERADPAGPSRPAPVAVGAGVSAAVVAAALLWWRRRAASRAP